MKKNDSIAVTVAEKSDFSGRNLGPLVLVNPMLEKMDIRRIVNLHCPQDPRLEIPIGDVIYTLVSNRLSSPEPLLHVADWADYSGAEFILGTPAGSLNDDRLARALDAVFAKRWNILADVALHVSKLFDVSLAKVHYDTTSFQFTGEYSNQSVNPSLLPDIRPFKIEIGRHSRPGAHVKEAQVGVNLANDGRGPVPFFYHSADGKANDQASVANNLQHLLKYLRPKRLLLVSDRGCFNAGHAVRMKHHNFDFISSLTWNDKFADLYDKKKPKMEESSFLSLKEKRKRRLRKPKKTWERYSIGETPYTITHEKQSIRARLIFVYSTADMKACQKAREKYTEKIHKGLAKIQQSVVNGYLKEAQAVHRKVSTLYGRKQAQKYFTYTVEQLTPQEIHSLPPRRQGQKKQTLKFSYTYHPGVADKDSNYDGLSALTTSLPKKTHTTDDVFCAFKEQHHIETSHHQWKAPIRLRPLFLKKVTRIESLILVQFLALMAFYLLQRLYRLSKGQSCRTTGETLIKYFAFCGFAVRYKENSVHVIPFPLKPAQTKVLEKLGFPPVEKQIKKYVTRRQDLDNDFEKGDI